MYFHYKVALFGNQHMIIFEVPHFSPFATIMFNKLTIGSFAKYQELTGRTGSYGETNKGTPLPERF